MNRTRVMVLGGAAVAAMMLGACEPKSAIRGNLPRPHQLEQIEVGSVDKGQVAEILGSPSSLGTFDSNVWYYISRQTEQWAFMEENVVDQQVLALYFDDAGMLQRMDRYTGEDARDIAYSDRVTPTAGKSMNFFEQMFGNFGRGALGGG